MAHRLVLLGDGQVALVVLRSVPAAVQQELRQVDIFAALSRSFLCVDKPGKEFTVAHPVPAAAQCVPVDVSTSNDRLTASLGTERLAAFRVTRPAYLAVAGARGPISAATVLTVVLLAPSAGPG